MGKENALRRLNARVIRGLALAEAMLVATVMTACLGVDDTAELESTQQAGSTQDHKAAADCVWAIMPAILESYVTIDEVRMWASDPDCDNGACTAANYPPDEMGGFLGYFEDWEERDELVGNANHFVSNPALEDINAETSRVGNLNGALGAAGAGEIRWAIRQTMRATHYAVDANQCGHQLGNAICDGKVVSEACQDFISQNNEVTNDENHSDLGYTAKTQIYWCEQLEAGTEAQCYAAVERGIRHHNNGVTLSDGTSNDCPSYCKSGECPDPALGTTNCEAAKNTARDALNFIANQAYYFRGGGGGGEEEGGGGEEEESSYDANYECPFFRDEPCNDGEFSRCGSEWNGCEWEACSCPPDSECNGFGYCEHVEGSVEYHGVD